MRSFTFSQRARYIVSGPSENGRQAGLPETLGVKLVERSPLRGIASVRQFDCLF